MPGVSVRIYIMISGQDLNQRWVYGGRNFRVLRLKNTGGRPDPSSSGCNSTKAGRRGLLSRLRGITCNIVVLDVCPSLADTRTSVGTELEQCRGD